MQKVLNSLKRHKRATSAAALILAVALIFAVVNNRAIVGASATDRSLPVYCVQRDDKCVSLTFDAAWSDVRMR
jgi:hypothetical protein